MEKKIIMKIEILPDKIIQGVLILLLVNGSNIISQHLHRILLVPGGDADAIRTQNEMHLGMPQEESGIPGAPWPKIPDSEWAELMKYVAIAHTPEVVAAYRAHQAILIAEANARQMVLQAEKEARDREDQEKQRAIIDEAVKAGIQAAQRSPN